MDLKALGKVLLVLGLALVLSGAVYVGLVAAFGVYYAGMFVDVMVTLVLAKVFVIDVLKHVYEGFKDTPYK
ncbi:putative membrane protein [Enterococcus phage Entf1]|uniref:Uncharacterized protein n=1 Tax=Enterococcus phage SSsP-1 TaxID=2859527 RepID=A0AAE7WEU2_9CAUD|nr:putative membrane protein [Enterococcus phage Entf1]QYI86624.1 hypothetical protein [Enterococcus phage SSsP-1]DAJ06210.1 MAG TPA: hypothetical protein [Caudoviricetes sp.]